MHSFKKLKKQFQNRKGIALFMVLASISVLSVLVTEFTYLSHLNQKLAYDQLDHVKAEYLAKSAYKLSLLRLKAYKTIKDLTQKKNSVVQLPQQLLDMIWSFPLTFPIPETLPGMTPLQQESIQKFNAETGLEGTFTAQMAPESTKYNLNALLPQYLPNQGNSNQNNNTNQNNSNQNQNNQSNNSNTSNNTNPKNKSANQKNQFDPVQARQSLQTFISELIRIKSEEDEAFANEYQGMRIDELVNNIYGWVDVNFLEALGYDAERPTRKGAAFYSLDELHMVPGIDDELYELLAPRLTTQVTPGIDVNRIDRTMLRALFPQFLEEELTEFFQFRDDPEQNNQFQSVDKFYEYLTTNVGAYRGGQTVIDQIKNEFSERNITLVVNEEVFKIEVNAKVNTATVSLTAIVLMTNEKSQQPKQNAGNGSPPAPNPAAPGGPQDTRTQGPRQSLGLRVTYFRMI